MKNSEIREHLNVIQEQLIAIPNKTENVSAKLEVINDVLATTDLKRQLRIRTNTSEPNVETKHAKAAEELLEELGILPEEKEDESILHN